MRSFTFGNPLWDISGGNRKVSRCFRLRTACGILRKGTIVIKTDRSTILRFKHLLMGVKLIVLLQ